MNPIYKKQGLVVITTTILIVCAAFIIKEPVENEPAADVKALDAKLLTDLQQQEIIFDKKTECLMLCNDISSEEIIPVLDSKNVNCGKFEPGNCHVTNYTIEGKTSSDKTVQFNVESGEDGNIISKFIVADSDCNCD